MSHASRITFDRDALQMFRDRTVAVLGDVMIDRYVSGVIDRISPEAPVPVLNYKAERAVLGGAANVAANVVSLGGRGRLVGVVGHDDSAATLRAMCEGVGVDAGGMVVDPGRPTTIKTRFVAQDQQLLRMDNENAGALGPLARENLLAAATDAIGASHAVVLSDYGKGVLADGLAAELIDRAHAGGCLVLVDPKSADLSVYRGADLLTPNLAELAKAAGVSTSALATDQAVVETTRGLIEKFGFGAIVVTLSARGMAVVHAEGEATVLPTRALEVYDVSGAGDTVAATIALGLAARFPLEQAAGLANHAAGVAVAHRGTARVTAAEVARAMAREQQVDKVAQRKQAVEAVRAWQDGGLSVGFTNGCFDIVHPGHIHILSSAAAACDRLVVGLNSDASVQRLKGPERPIQDEASRAAVMAALHAVDLVTVFDEDTPAELIAALKPDVLVKGADYALEDIVGADVVTARGGKVVRVPLVEGKSTTAIANRIRTTDPAREETV